MNVNELLDTIEDLLEESTGMPLSGGKRIVDVEQIRDYLDDIRANLPVELRQAQSIVGDRAQLIESANAQAQAIVKKAEERARIKVLRFIVGFPFLYKNICEINSFRQRGRLSGFAKGPIPEGAVCEADWGSWLNFTRCERSSAKIRGCAPLWGWRKTHAREPAPLPRRSP